MSEKLFAIHVGGTSELDCRCSMRNVSCRVSIISIKTGELLTKSSPERKVLSFYESTNVKYISPVTTKFIDATFFSDILPKTQYQSNHGSIVNHTLNELMISLKIIQKLSYFN